MAYAAAKGGVIGMTKPLARDLGPYKIRVTAVAPGVFYNLNADHLPKQLINLMQEATPIGRIGRPHELAHLV